MSALEIRRAGYPTRMTYREFVNQFRVFDVSSKNPHDLPDVTVSN
jgi:myosin heavy subunit